MLIWKEKKRRPADLHITTGVPKEAQGQKTKPRKKVEPTSGELQGFFLKKRRGGGGLNSSLKSRGRRGYSWTDIQMYSSYDCKNGGRVNAPNQNTR